MEIATAPCPSCGAPRSLATGRCPRCAPEAQPQGPREAPGAAREPAPQAPGGVAGPAEFEAEECLARGDPDRALVLVSRALQDRPQSLTLRAVFERARKAVLRGRRGDRLEERIREAHDLFARGDLGAAERIVASALKLIPNHAAALSLFAKIREQRLSLPAVEAEVERELERMARAQARTSLERALALRAAGNERGAFIAVRRGLERVPDDSDLLGLFAELQERLARVAAQQASLRARVQEARVRLVLGSIVESRDILREVLRKDPDFAPAQKAMAAVRAAHLARVAPPASAVPAARNPPVAVAAPRPPAPREGEPPGRWSVWALTGAIALGAAVVVTSVLLIGRWRRADDAQGSRPGARGASAPRGGALAVQEAGLRVAVEGTLAAYRGALEACSSAALAAARPDLDDRSRAVLLGPFRGAIKASVEIQVLEVELTGDRAEVRVRRTSIVVGGVAPPLPPTEETLRFIRRAGAWSLS